MFKEEILERFLRYAVVDTQSIEALADKKHPSFEGEWDLLRLLEKELRELGLTDVNLDEHGYLLARLPATAEGLPTIAFSSHVDTADDVEGNHVKPVVNDYKGGDIVLKNGGILALWTYGQGGGAARATAATLGGVSGNGTVRYATAATFTLSVRM